jgi:hypothetical protein
VGKKLLHITGAPTTGATHSAAVRGRGVMRFFLPVKTCKMEFLIRELKKLIYDIESVDDFIAEVEKLLQDVA